MSRPKQDQKKLKEQQEEEQSYSKNFELELPQAFKVEDQGPSYPGGPPQGASSLWPNPLTPPPSSTDLQQAAAAASAAAVAAASANNPITASANPSHLSLHAHHTNLSVPTSSMKGKIN